MTLCSGLTLLSFVLHVSVSPWYDVYIHELCMTLTFDLNIKIIFPQWIWVWQDVFALWHRQTKFLHMCVSPWDNMLFTFLTLVWPWPLTYMWVAGVSLVRFTYSFNLVSNRNGTHIWYCFFIYFFLNFQFNLVCDNVFLRSNLKISYLAGFFVASMFSQLSDVYVLVQTRQDNTLIIKR